MPSHPTIDVETYADELVRLVSRDSAADPNRFGKARSWTDLHDVCDANEYLIDADEKFGFEWSPDCAASYWNAAVAIAERKLFQTSTFIVTDIQTVEPDELTQAPEGVVVEVDPNYFDSMGFNRADVSAPTRAALISYVLENWGDEDKDWFQTYIVDRIEETQREEI